MRSVVSPAFALAAVLAVSCSSSSSSPPAVNLLDPTASGATLDAGTAASTCPGGTSACGASGWCCATGTECLANAGDALGCGTDYCCAGCGAGVTCGGGCCASGTYCVANPGGVPGCTGALCCSPTPEQNPCPADVAAQCAAGTRCVENHSARYCPGGYACYLPDGQVGCPGEVLCPNAVDFCPSGTYCDAIAGVCQTGSTSGTYCCTTYAQSGESCDTTQCAPGLWCVDNPHCSNSDPTAAKTCRGPCTSSFPVDCVNFCCPSAYPICGASTSCTCYG